MEAMVVEIILGLRVGTEMISSHLTSPIFNYCPETTSRRQAEAKRIGENNGKMKQRLDDKQDCWQQLGDDRKVKRLNGRACVKVRRELGQPQT